MAWIVGRGIRVKCEKWGDVVTLANGEQTNRMRNRGNVIPTDAGWWWWVGRGKCSAAGSCRAYVQSKSKANGDVATEQNGRHDLRSQGCVTRVKGALYRPEGGVV
jgi:hypothetical protein